MGFQPDRLRISNSTWKLTTAYNREKDDYKRRSINMSVDLLNPHVYQQQYYHIGNAGIRSFACFGTPEP